MLERLIAAVIGGALLTGCANSFSKENTPQIIGKFSAKEHELIEKSLEKFYKTFPGSLFKLEIVIEKTEFNDPGATYANAHQNIDYTQEDRIKNQGSGATENQQGQKQYFFPEGTTDLVRICSIDYFTNQMKKRQKN